MDIIRIETLIKTGEPFPPPRLVYSDKTHQTFSSSHSSNPSKNHSQFHLYLPHVVVEFILQRPHQFDRRLDYKFTTTLSALIGIGVMPIENTAGYMIPVLPSNDLSDPFGQLGLDLSDSELRETAYEIFVGACRSSGGGRPLTFVSQSSGRSSDRASSLPSLQRSLTLTTTSKVKKALGMKSKKKNNNSESNGSSTENRPATVGELMRVQMRISEQIDSRVRRALLRIADGQVIKLITYSLCKFFCHHSNHKLFAAWQAFQINSSTGRTFTTIQIF